MKWRWIVAGPPVIALIPVWLLAIALEWVVDVVMVPLTEWSDR
jgi:hypothetical protein